MKGNEEGLQPEVLGVGAAVQEGWERTGRTGWTDRTVGGIEGVWLPGGPVTDTPPGSGVRVLEGEVS